MKWLKITVAVGLVAVLLACAPPPAQPAPLPGESSFTGANRLTFVVIDQNGNIIFDCDLVEWATFDLGFTSLRTLSKSSAEGCPRSDWLNVSATASCGIGSNTLSCGAGWALNTSPAFVEKFFQFTRTPHLAVISVLLQGVFRVNGTPTSITGNTPQIRCSNELQQCKFQV